MKCRERLEMINGCCLRCDDDWQCEKMEYKLNHGKEAGPDEFYVWVVKPNEWEVMKKKK